MPRRKAEAAQAALGDAPAAPRELATEDGIAYYVSSVALGYTVAEIGQRARALVAALRARYPRSKVRVEIKEAYGDEVLSNLLAPLRLVSISSDDARGQFARAHEVAGLREEATREVLAFVERWLEGGGDGDDPAR